MKSMLASLVTFDGRASRRDIWIFHISVTLAAVLLAVGNSAALHLMPVQAVNLTFLGLFILLVAFAAVPYACLFARRCHDLGYGGWWALTLLIPLVGALALAALMLVPGNSGPNRFGEPPHPRPAVA
jgi:uncharacterized membrane protein YhaH (DUF805 family)